MSSRASLDQSVRDAIGADPVATLHAICDLASRLAEQIGSQGEDASAPLPGRSVSGKDSLLALGNAEEEFVRSVRPPLPDPRLVRRIIRQRQLRARYFDIDLFADPAWDMLLDLTAARVEHIRVSVTSLCIASGVPGTTALRWIGEMVKAGLFFRVEDDTDRRRAFIALTDRAASGMANYFADIGRTALLP